ncbi:hypothetical protein LTR10_010321 [Elasticomyces elasticus]|nr:hypothetical protein LTR10_010321 [Elasticomyces elasticus]KAK4972225.1 hypothetical protein LTR42_006731 [Elasticomyces elasticus]
MRQSFFATALCLSLVHTSVEGRAHNKFAQLKIRNGQPVVEPAEQGGVLGWAQDLFRRVVKPRQSSGTCYEDLYFNFVEELPNSESFCQGYMDYPNETVTVDYTPTSTFTYTYTTDVITETELTRTTRVSTVTVTSTPVAKAKRDAAPQITARAALDEASIAQVFNMFRRQNGDTSSMGTLNDTASMSSAFSSACSCQNYGGATVTETYTNDAEVATLSAFGATTSTVTTTRGARATTTTVTVVAPPPALSSPAAPASSVNATAIASTTSSSPAAPATPTALPVTCPDENGDVISQMVAAERFDYIVNCSTDLTSSNFYGALYYPTFGQCISACSIADANFSSPVCQGVSYYNSPNIDGYNCFLKTSGNGSVPMPGVDSAILLRIVMGVDAQDPDGTTTEAVPFGGMTATLNPGQMSSSMSEMMGNSTSSMPMITPGPPMPQSGLLVNAGGYTSFSTYVSAGTTYSTGTVFSTYHSESGSWYESYYTSYSLQWASATTEYAIGAQETQIAGTNTTTTSQSNGADGGYSIISDRNSTTYYPGGYNVTEVISNQTYASNGTELSSTAVTSFYSYQTGGGSSGSNGGSSGGNSNGSIITNEAGVTSTSFYSTQTVIINSGATGGASGYAASGVNGASATTIYASGGTAYSSGYVISGGFGGTGGASGYANSGAITSVPASPSATVITNVNGTAYSSGFAASGVIGGTGGASGNAGSGAIETLPASTSATVILSTGGTAFSSGFAASGSVGGTGGSSGTAASGSIPSSPVSTSNLPRTGEYSTTTPLGTAPLNTAPSAGFPSGYTPVLPPLSTGTSPLTDTGNRTGSQSPPLSTGPAPYTSELPRTGEYSTTSDSFIISFPTGYPPFVPSSPSSGAPPSYQTNGSISVITGTGTSPMSTSNLPRTGEYSTTSPTLVAYPPVSTPSGPRTGEYSTTAPASSGSPVPSGNDTTSLVPTMPPSYPSLPISSGSPLPSLNSTLPPPTGSFSNSGLPRTGSQAPSSSFTLGTGTSPPIYTLPTPPPPYIPASCSNYTMGTITVTETFTSFGCFDTCPPTSAPSSGSWGPPGGYGPYAAPQAFGPEGGAGWSNPHQFPPAAETTSA